MFVINNKIADKWFMGRPLMIWNICTFAEYDDIVVRICYLLDWLCLFILLLFSMWFQLDVCAAATIICAARHIHCKISVLLVYGNLLYFV